MDTHSGCQATPGTLLVHSGNQRGTSTSQPEKKKAPSVTSQAWEAASEASIPIAPSNMDMCIEARWQSHNPNSCSHLFHKWINLSGPNRFDQDQTTLLKLFRHFQAGYKLGTRTTFFRNTHFIDCLFSC